MKTATECSIVGSTRRCSESLSRDHDSMEADLDRRLGAVVARLRSRDASQGSRQSQLSTHASAASRCTAASASLEQSVEPELFVDRPFVPVPFESLGHVTPSQAVQQSTRFLKRSALESQGVSYLRLKSFPDSSLNRFHSYSLLPCPKLHVAYHPLALSDPTVSGLFFLHRHFNVV
jgi:hypothetical protein